MQLISIGQFHKVIEKYLYWLSLPSIGFTDILEIIIISVIVYQMLKWVQLTRAWTLFKGIIMLLLFALFAAIFSLIQYHGCFLIHSVLELQRRSLFFSRNLDGHWNS